MAVFIAVTRDLTGVRSLSWDDEIAAAVRTRSSHVLDPIITIIAIVFDLEQEQQWLKAIR